MFSSAVAIDVIHGGYEPHMKVLVHVRSMWYPCAKSTSTCARPRCTLCGLNTEGFEFQCKQQKVKWKYGQNLIFKVEPNRML